MKGYRFFLNRNNATDGFHESVSGRYYVDKSKIITFINSKISTKEKWICVTHPRRFGKSMVVEMLASYYTKGCKAEELFRGLKVKEDPSFYQHLNKHNVIYMNFSGYFENTIGSDGGIEKLSENLLHDLKEEYPGLLDEKMELPLALDMVQQVTGSKFIFLIDEWDTIFRFQKNEKAKQEQFLGFLKLLFKDRTYVELVYMTGILPIKKYNTGSALNMFREYTMLEPKQMDPYFGFSKEEVKELCQTASEDMFEELTEWYDGYCGLGGVEKYNPRSVIEALESGICSDYWANTGGFSELEDYITMDFDGLGQAVTRLLGGEEIPVNVLGFSNDLDSFRDKDEVITALIHLGYLTIRNGKARIPNREMQEEFGNTIKKLSWGEVSRLLNQSKRLLEATQQMDAETVAQILEGVHDGMHEFKEYNNEHTLKCVIHLAYYAAIDEYELKFEENAGKGIADCIMIPRKQSNPGIILELKYDGNVDEALTQIKTKNYITGIPDRVKQVILVGINYDKKTKRHECKMECIKR